MNPFAIIALISEIITDLPTADEVSDAWNLVAKIVSEKRDPTPAEWAAVGRTPEQAHAAVQAVSS